ncbi:hypothetical protein Tco_1126881 [Tanacetum coccineum]
MYGAKFKSEFPNEDMKQEFSGWFGLQDDHDVIHFDNSSNLAFSTSLNDLDFATLNIDGQSMDVDTSPDIIDVDEDNDFIDDEDVLPHDLMSADVARGHCGDGGGDDHPPPSQIFTGCRDETRDVEGIRSYLPRTSSSQIRISRLTIGLMLRTLPEPFKMLKTGQRARSSAGKEPGHLLSSEICRTRREFNMDLGANTPTGVPYTEDQIMAIVRRGKQQGHIPGVGRVLAGQGRGVISINEPRCTHTDADVNEVKEESKKLRKELNMQMTVVRSDDQMSQLLTQL